MIGLDTPVLLRLLRGDPGTREVLQKLEGEELATTEWNLLELELLARADPSPGRERRRAALEKLRRRLTVLPIDQRAVEVLSEGRRSHSTASPLGLSAVLGALESRGCAAWLTDGRTAASAPPTSLRTVVVRWGPKRR